MKTRVKNLLVWAARRLYWSTRAYVDDPVMEQALSDSYLQGRSAVDPWVQRAPSRRREDFS